MVAQEVWTTKKKTDGNVFVGLLLLALGAFFLLDNLHIVYVGDIWSFWPFVLVIIGVQKAVSADAPDRAGSGLWLVFLGLWLYVSIEEIWGLGFGETWPALLIAWGIGMIWRSFGRPWPFGRKETVA